MNFCSAGTLLFRYLILLVVLVTCFWLLYTYIMLMCLSQVGNVTKHDKESTCQIRLDNYARFYEQFQVKPKAASRRFISKMDRSVARNISSILDFKLSLVWYCFSLWFLEVKLISSLLPMRFSYCCLGEEFKSFGEDENICEKINTILKNQVMLILDEIPRVTPVA